jgi:hypothetical protein
MKTIIPALCNKCGQAANVCVFKTDAQTVTDPHDVAVFCEKCALQGIHDLPPCPHLVIVVALRCSAEAAGRVRREYQVLELNHSANVAKIKVVGGDDPAPLDLVMAVRYDSIPIQARAVGRTCAIIGVPLEVALFEHSGPM